MCSPPPLPRREVKDRDGGGLEDNRKGTVRSKFGVMETVNRHRSWAQGEVTVLTWDVPNVCSTQRGGTCHLAAREAEAKTAGWGLAGPTQWN